MPGYILLAGGAEFGGRMAEPDRRAIALAGGPSARISVIPAAAAPDHNHERAGRNATEWFRSLGAADVVALPLIDRAAADDQAIADALRGSRLIYLLGGFTDYLGRTLLGSASWQAMQAAYHAGAVIAGSSAGAMVLCSHYYDPQAQQVRQGLALVPHSCLLPHHNTFGKGWAARLATLLPSATLIGVDERTAAIDDDTSSLPPRWRVYGQGQVTLYHDGTATAYASGEAFAFIRENDATNDRR